MKSVKISHVVIAMGVLIVMGLTRVLVDTYLSPHPIVIEPMNTNDANPVSIPHITVHVAGHVADPGVYSIPIGSRVMDAIDIAGGALPNGNLNSLNLAKTLKDGQRITLKLLPHSKLPSQAKFSVNAASQDELMACTGVGPSLSGRIIHYRGQNGPFKSLDDLEKVSGIGSKLLIRLKDCLRL